MELMGYTFDFDFVREGTQATAQIKNRTFSITISKIKKVVNNQVENMDESISDVSLVEVWTTSTDEELNEASEEWSAFAEFLSPVELTKIDLTKKPVPQALPPSQGSPQHSHRAQQLGGITPILPPANTGTVRLL